MIFLCEVTGSEELWAKHGLTGLVIFALIGVILVLVKVITKILKEAREERKFTTEKHIEAIERTAKEHTNSTDKLSTAIDRLTTAFRNDGH